MCLWQGEYEDKGNGTLVVSSLRCSHNVHRIPCLRFSRTFQIYRAEKCTGQEDRKALDQLSFEMAKPGITALLGHNGAGLFPIVTLRAYLLDMLRWSQITRGERLERVRDVRSPPYV